MNAPAHCYPVIKVIDPLSNPSEPRAVDYGIHVAFAASGAILGQMLGLMKLQRAQAFADMEDIIRHEMEEDKYRAKRAKDAAAAIQRAAAQAIGRKTQEEMAEAKRAEWRARILQAIRDGHSTAKTIRRELNMSASLFDKHITHLRDTGAVRVWQERNHRGTGGSHNVYEVAQ